MKHGLLLVFTIVTATLLVLTTTALGIRIKEDARTKVWVEAELSPYFARRALRKCIKQGRTAEVDTVGKADVVVYTITCTPTPGG